MRHREWDGEMSKHVSEPKQDTKFAFGKTSPVKNGFAEMNDAKSQSICVRIASNLASDRARRFFRDSQFTIFTENKDGVFATVFQT